MCSIAMLSCGIVLLQGQVSQGAGEALVFDVPEGMSMTYADDIDAASINKTGGGDALVNADSVVLSGRATSSAGTLRVTGGGTRSFGSLMAADGVFEFFDAGTVFVKSGGFVRSSSLCAMMSFAGATVMESGSGTWQIAAESGQRGFLRVDEGSSLSVGASQMGKSGVAYCVLDGGAISVSGATTLSENGGTVCLVADGGMYVSTGAVSVAMSCAGMGAETLVAALGESGVFKSIGSDASDFSVGGSAAHRTIVAACDGGVFGAAHVMKKSTDATLHLGFNGGVLSPTYPYDFFGGHEPDSLTIYEKGLVIDTSETKNGGSFGAVWLTKPATGPTGLSIASIDLPTDPAFYAESYSGPVPVTISGTGVGAAVFASYDAVTRKIVSIRIACPGTGYDGDTTATIPSEDGKSSYACSVVMTEAKNTGSLTKRGGATFRLYGGNEYGGDTIAEGGELILWSDDSLPVTSGIFCRNGATFNLNNKCGGMFTVPRLGGSGGKISNGDIKVTEELAFDGAEIAVATNPLQMTGSLSLGQDVRLTVLHPKSLMPGVRYEVLRAAGGILGTIVEDGRFKVEIADGSIFLTRKPLGLILMVR